MPHDAKGNELRPGDKVVIPATVITVFQGEDGLYCNCNLELEYCMPPYTEKSTYSSINTKQVVKVVDSEPAN